MSNQSGAEISMIETQGLRIELIERGAGKPLLFLHPGIGIEPDAPVLDLLAKQTRVLAPSHPGFGHSDLPKWMSGIDDLAYFYLDFLEAHDIRNAVVVGASLGGWIAAEMAIKTTERISHLVLVDAAGIKVGDREHRDFVDFFSVSQAELDALSFYDQKLAQRDYRAMSEAALTTHFRNRESTGLFAWSPYMHSPKLRRRLHRIKIPTLVLWGANDRIVSPDYGRAYAAEIRGARFDLIDGSGHYPHIEQPAVFADKVLAFAQG
jgi:pimeloyl-ACP methyl ester carboxylesterase